MYKEGLQGNNGVFKIFYNSKYNEDFCIIGISSAILEFEYCVLILIQKGGVRSYKIKFSEE